MDAKERWLIEQLHTAILSGSFTERDVLALLITLRNHLLPLRNHREQDKLVLEFGDFVAHREKDRGILQRYLHSVQSALRGELAANGEPSSFTVLSFESVRNSFNKVFRSLELPELDAELANQITVCIISLLQSVEIRATRARKRARDAHLYRSISCGIRGEKMGSADAYASATSLPKLLVGISREYIALLGQGRLAARHSTGDKAPVMVFPILMARNNYVELPSSCTAYMILDRVVEACSINGDFRFAQRAPAA